MFKTVLYIKGFLIHKKDTVQQVLITGVKNSATDYKIEEILMIIYIVTCWVSLVT
jgi:hypothetical protein